MKKKDLIKLMEPFNDNDDIIIWNGVVGDWQELGEVKDFPLFKFRKKFIRQLWDKESEKYNEPKYTDAEVTKRYKEENYEYPNSHWLNKPELMAEAYKKKTFILLVPARKGKTHLDRAGSIKY